MTIDFYNSGKISRVNYPMRHYPESYTDRWAFEAPYCYLCGTKVYNQKFCHNCGAFLDWEFRKTVPKKLDYWERCKYYHTEL